MTTVAGSEKVEVGHRHTEIPLRTFSALNQQIAEVPVLCSNNTHSHVIVFTSSNERDSSNHTAAGADRKSLYLQGMFGTHAFPLRMSTARSYE